MRIHITLLLLGASLVAFAQTSSDTARLRIISDRGVLKADFAVQEAACYKKFMVNDCLDEAMLKRSNGLANLRRQESLLNDAERKAKGAAQVQKIDDKASLEKQQQVADRRSDALKETQARGERQRQGELTRAAAQSKANPQTDAAVRMKNNLEKADIRANKQAKVAAQTKKYNDRLAKSQERQTRRALDNASQTKLAAQPLPVP